MTLDTSLAVPGTVNVDVGGDVRGGGNYPSMDAGRPCTISWEEVMGQTSGFSLGDISGVGAGAETLTEGTTKLKNGLCDAEVEGSQGSKIARITVVGCVDST